MAIKIIEEAIERLRQPYRYQQTQCVEKPEERIMEILLFILNRAKVEDEAKKSQPKTKWVKIINGSAWYNNKVGKIYLVYSDTKDFMNEGEHYSVINSEDGNVIAVEDCEDLNEYKSVINLRDKTIDSLNKKLEQKNLKIFQIEAGNKKYTKALIARIEKLTASNADLRECNDSLESNIGVQATNIHKLQDSIQELQRVNELLQKQLAEKLEVPSEDDIGRYAQEEVIECWNDLNTPKRADKPTQADVEWERLKVDTLVLVTGNYNNFWLKRHLKRADENYIKAFKEGCTSWSKNNNEELNYSCWERYKLPDHLLESWETLEACYETK